MKPAKCLATNQDGSPCSAQPQLGARFCKWHDPALAEKRRQWSAKGGQARSNKARAKKQLPDGALTSAEVHALLCLTLKRVIAGVCEPGIGNAAANLARALTTVREASELEERLVELERAAGVKVAR